VRRQNTDVEASMPGRADAARRGWVTRKCRPVCGGDSEKRVAA